MLLWRTNKERIADLEAELKHLKESFNVLHTEVHYDTRKLKHVFGESTSTVGGRIRDRLNKLERLFDYFNLESYTTEAVGPKTILRKKEEKAEG